MAVDQNIENQLRALVVDRIGEDALRGFSVEDYFDHNGEQALRITLTFDAQAFDEIDRLDLMTDLFDALRERKIDLFPYTTFLREGEAA
ncbi:hypothetical protein [Jannaschia marina]|uniref:hypothetical protein n=1 Tax=Jannaschia marina TaxID=2741674 RepID=UPI0015C73ACA|nr:hypothetical protein [Jannaschia marina]